jgi:hypothetical protein
MEELTAPNGKPGLTVYMTFPLGFDPEGGFNAQLKQAMRKGTVGVGMTVVVDKDGKICWYVFFLTITMMCGGIRERT